MCKKFCECDVSVHLCMWVCADEFKSVLDEEGIMCVCDLEPVGL